ncbi:MAG: CarD family transcriptional regulator [Clostridia bacterium]|nr:CarD family transcriptional regulator [Clostridia bacterium]
MYSVGERIVYGNSGVCEVKEIIPSPFGKPGDGRLFYVLAPVFDTSNMMIYTPVDCDNVVIREPVSADCARSLLDRIPLIEPLEIPVEKQRREIYREIVRRTDLADYVSVIKTVEIRRAEFKKTRRRLPDMDSDAEHTSRNCLYCEIACALGIEREEVHNIVSELLKR